MNRVAIIGAGRFGMALAESLSESGVEVLLVERNGSLVQSAINVVASAVQGDATNARALEDAGLGECEVAVVAIGSNVEASLLATANCKELGVGTVIAKATSELHGKILEKLGAGTRTRRCRARSSCRVRTTRSTRTTSASCSAPRSRSTP